MFDVLKTLSDLVRSRKPVTATPSLPAKPSQKPQLTPAEPPFVTDDRRAAKTSIKSADIEAALKLAQAQARELILEAKDEALRIRRGAEEDARRRLEAIEEREKQINLRL